MGLCQTVLPVSTELASVPPPQSTQMNTHDVCEKSLRNRNMFLSQIPFGFSQSTSKCVSCRQAQPSKGLSLNYTNSCKLLHVLYLTKQCVWHHNLQPHSIFKNIHINHGRGTTLVWMTSRPGVEKSWPCSLATSWHKSEHRSDDQGECQKPGKEGTSIGCGSYSNLRHLHERTWS